MEITLQQAGQSIQLAKAKADEIKVAADIAILDTAGYLKSFMRMDGAFIGSIDIALQKARTSMLFGMSSEAVGEFLKPSNGAYGIEHTNGGLLGFAGGKPIVSKGKIIGYIGVSGGTAGQDLLIATAGSDL